MQLRYVSPRDKPRVLNHRLPKLQPLGTARVHSCRTLASSLMLLQNFSPLRQMVIGVGIEVIIL